ncbi:zinc-binding alcohol dehydrogenase family protein [Kribbella sp. NPDC058245]|uniref:quinone oxidoreductase family protein n=1 Tax=Kribbella sp. NPDC058245 TaxID=3346399 RepID=UPI0036E4D2D3
MVQAIGVTEAGDADALTVLDLAPEPLGDGEVRIRVTHATVNPVDGMLRSREGDGVRVPGMEVAGVVQELGGDLPFAVGDAVMAIVVPDGEHGGYRAEVVVPALSVVKLPAGLSPAQAATLPMNGLTAQIALDTLALPAGATVAVTGSAGTVGGYFIQVAKHAGLTVIADAAPADEAFVRACGADEIVARGNDFAAAVRQQHPAGVDGLVDTARQEAAVLDAVKDGGTVITVSGYAGDGTDRVEVTPIFVFQAAQNADALQRVATLAASGVLTTRVAGELPAIKASEAHRALEQRGLRGRYVLQFD